MGRVDGKVVIVTGAARGQGAATARLFASEGASVVLTDLLEAEGEAVGELRVDALDGLQDALASVATLAVAQLVGLVDPRAGAGGDRRPTVGAGGQEHLCFDGRVAARVEDLASVNADDFAHGADPIGRGGRGAL